MNLPSRLRDHAIRVRRHLGAPVKIGSREYRVAGYFSSILAIDDTREENVRRVIARLLRRPGAFIDVGVNLGQTLGRVLSADPDRRYIGFEPQVGACFQVERFIRSNALTSAQVLPIGLADADGLRRFWSVGDADCMASLMDERSGGYETVIQVRRGDDVLKEMDITEIAAIKIDVEGAEAQVLKGLSETLSRYRPPVLLEVLPAFGDPAGTTQGEAFVEKRRQRAQAVHALLEALEYRIFQIGEDGSERRIDEFVIDDPAAFEGFNYLVRHRDDPAKADGP